MSRQRTVAIAVLGGLVAVFGSGVVYAATSSKPAAPQVPAPAGSSVRPTSSP